MKSVAYRIATDVREGERRERKTGKGERGEGAA